MKGKLFIGYTALALSFTSTVHADFTFYANTNNCTHVSGDWKGAGTAHHWLLDCAYNGSGSISKTDDSGNFTLDVVADKASGSLLCPQHTEHKLSGSCTDGVVTVKTEYGNLTGIFSADSGSSNGILNVAPGIDVTVAIQFQRK